MLDKVAVLQESGFDPSFQNPGGSCYRLHEFLPLLHALLLKLVDLPVVPVDPCRQHAYLPFRPSPLHRIMREFIADPLDLLPILPDLPLQCPDLPRNVSKMDYGGYLSHSSTHINSSITSSIE